MTVVALLGLGPRRWRDVRVRVRLHQPKPPGTPAKRPRCPHCPRRRWWRPDPLLPRCRHCGDTGIQTEWRTEPPR